MWRAVVHDNSKFTINEAPIFGKVFFRLRSCTFGSDEYQELLDAVEPALKYHYRKNRHHPQFYKDGVAGMNLIDLVEMFYDGKAATKKHADGDIRRSIVYNCSEKRFDFDAQLANIYWNSI